MHAYFFRYVSDYCPLLTIHQGKINEKKRNQTEKSNEIQKLSNKLQHEFIVNKVSAYVYVCVNDSVCVCVHVYLF